MSLALSPTRGFYNDFQCLCYNFLPFDECSWPPVTIYERIRCIFQFIILAQSENKF